MPSLVILVSAILVLSCGQTDRITFTEVDDRYTHMTKYHPGCDFGGGVKNILMSYSLQPASRC